MRPQSGSLYERKWWLCLCVSRYVSITFLLLAGAGAVVVTVAVSVAAAAAAAIAYALVLRCRISFIKFTQVCDMYLFCSLPLLFLPHHAFCIELDDWQFLRCINQVIIYFFDEIYDFLDFSVFLHFFHILIELTNVFKQSKGKRNRQFSLLNTFGT